MLGCLGAGIRAGSPYAMELLYERWGRGSVGDFLPSRIYETVEIVPQYVEGISNIRSEDRASSVEVEMVVVRV